MANESTAAEECGSTRVQVVSPVCVPGRLALTNVIAMSNSNSLSLLISIKGSHASHPRGAPAREIHLRRNTPTAHLTALQRTSEFRHTCFWAPVARSHVYACFYRTRKTRRVRDLVMYSEPLPGPL